MSDLRNTVVAINLGKCLYYARCERFNLRSIAWEALDVSERHDYTERANELLETLRPAPSDFSAHLFDTAVGMARVIGGADVFNRTR